MLLYLSELKFIYAKNHLSIQNGSLYIIWRANLDLRLCPIKHLHPNCLQKSSAILEGIYLKWPQKRESPWLSWYWSVMFCFLFIIFCCWMSRVESLAVWSWISKCRSFSKSVDLDQRGPDTCRRQIQYKFALLTDLLWTKFSFEQNLPNLTKSL